MALIYLGYRKFVKGDKKKKGDDSEEPENKTVESEMEIEKSNAKKKTVSKMWLLLVFLKVLFLR